jgi:hypothetical protein
MLFVYLPFMLFDGFLNVLGQSHGQQHQSDAGTRRQQARSDDSE